MKTMNSAYGHISAAAGILLRKDQILAGQRPDGKPLAGYWELPGGKLELDETPTEALVRELVEELGIKVDEAVELRTITHPYPERGFVVKVHFFLVKKFRGVPCSREGQHLRWISYAELKEFDFLPPDTIILEELRAGKFQDCDERKAE